MPRTPTPPRKRPQPQQDTQNSMFPFFRKTDEESPEPKRLNRKDLEEQVASLNEQLSTAENEKTKAERSSADAQHVLKKLNAELNGQVSALENTCDGLKEDLRKMVQVIEGLQPQYDALEKTCRRLRAKNEQKVEQLNKQKDLHEKNLKERETVAYRAFEGVNVQLIAANKSLLEQRETVASLKLKLDKSNVTARSVLKLHNTNKSLEEENKHLKVAYENIESEMEKLKQTTRTEIAACESKRLAQGLAYNTLLTNRDTVKDAFVEAAKAFVMQKKRKLDVEQSSAGASLPIADVVSCYATETSDRCVMTKGPTKGP